MLKNAIKLHRYFKIAEILTLRGGSTISTGARRSAWDGRRRRPENGDDGDLWIDELAARSGNSICVEFWIEFAYNTTSEDM